MAAQTHSKTQLPVGSIVGRPAGEEAHALRRGLEAGRDTAAVAMRRIAAWTEEHPGQALLVGLAAGFLLGKLLFRRRPAVIEELD